MRYLLSASLLLASSPASAKELPPPPPPAHPGWTQVRDEGVRQMTSKLIDPGSAIVFWNSGFVWGFTKWGFSKRTYLWIACGSMNAKNRMGGYVGAKSFWIAADLQGAVTSGWGESTISTCDHPTGVPVNSELQDNGPFSRAANGALFSVADELQKLAVLKVKGLITQIEFDEQKARLLAR